MRQSERWESEAAADSRSSLGRFLHDTSLTEGQRRRLSLFRTVEDGVCAQIEQLCAASGMDVTDIAVLVVDASAHAMFFDGVAKPNGACVMLGHRERLYAFLRSVLPPAEGTSLNPYEDLLKPAPSCSVRVLIVDPESLMVMSYGTFVTVRLDGEMAEA